MNTPAHSTMEGARTLTELDSKAFLARAGIPVIESRLAQSREDTARCAEEIGLPVVLKIASPEIVHKSDCGGVRLSLRSAAEVAEAYDQIVLAAGRAHPEARIQGVSVQRMAPSGQETIIGMSKDPQFGPLLMFGIGGVMVEIMGDVSFRIAPLTPKDAREMIREIKGYPLLAGFRGRDPVDTDFLERLLLDVSSLLESHPEIKELDLNPVMAYRTGALVVDARIVLEEASSEQKEYP